MNQEEMEHVPHYGNNAAKWPVIWGIVAIVFGVIGLLAQAFKAMQSAAMMIMPDNLYDNIATPPPTGDPVQDKMMEDMMESQQEMMNSIADMAPMSIASAIFLAVIAILLTVGGILLCMRKRVASPVLQIWAGLKIVGTFFGVWVGYTMMNSMMGSQSEMMNNIVNAPGVPSGSSSINFGGIFTGFAMVTSVIGLLWGIWLPIYFFILFNRAAIKEDMAQGPGWVNEPIE